MHLSKILLLTIVLHQFCQAADPSAPSSNHICSVKYSDEMKGEMGSALEFDLSLTNKYRDLLSTSVGSIMSANDFVQALQEIHYLPLSPITPYADTRYTYLGPPLALFKDYFSWFKNIDFFRVSFVGAKFSGSLFEGTCFADCDFRRCQLLSCKFTGTTFINCSFEETEPTGSIFDSCTFTTVHFGQKMVKATFWQCQITDL
jgi:hypothetical protein